MLKVFLIYINGWLPTVISRHNLKTCILKAEAHTTTAAKQINYLHYFQCIFLCNLQYIQQV